MGQADITEREWLINQKRTDEHETDIGQIKVILKRVEDKVDEQEKWIDGSNGAGAKTRIGILEGRAARNDKRFWLIVTALTGIAATLAGRLIWAAFGN